MYADPTPSLQPPAALNSPWWQVLLRGLIMLGLSVFAFFQPVPTAVVLMRVLAVFLILDGLLALLSAITGSRRGSPRGLLILRSLIMILGGALIYAFDLLSVSLAANLLAVFVGAAAILGGLLDIVTVFRMRRRTGLDWGALLGALMLLVFGLLVLLSPQLFSLLLVRVLAIAAGIGGLLMVVISLQVRGYQKGP